jgi:transcription antitermination factor NusG
MLTEEAKVQWFALRVRSRHEKSTAVALEHKGIEQLLPLYRARRLWSDRACDIDLPLFPGYVFCRFDSKLRVPIVTTPGVIDIVRIGKDPQPVDPAEIAALRLAVSSGQLLRPWPFLRVGQRVVIGEGPLRTVQGMLVQEKGEAQLVLSITLLQRSVAVTVDRSWVRPSSSPELN